VGAARAHELEERSAVGVLDERCQREPGDRGPGLADHRCRGEVDFAHQPVRVDREIANRGKVEQVREPLLALFQFRAGSDQLFMLDGHFFLMHLQLVLELHSIAVSAGRADPRDLRPQVIR